jgi:hypothetical protein
LRGYVDERVYFNGKLLSAYKMDQASPGAPSIIGEQSAPLTRLRRYELNH